MPYGVDAVEQFQVVTSGGQAELGRALGGYVNVVTQERHQRAARRRLRLLPRRPLQRGERALGHDAADVRSSSTAASLGGPIAPRPHVLLRQRRAAAARPDRADDDLGRERRHHQRAAGRGRLPGVAGRRPAIYPQPGPQRPTCSARSITSSAAAISCSVRYSLYDVTSSNSRGAGGAERAIGVGRARQHRSDDRVQQHADALAAHGQRDARAVHLQRPEGAADRSDRPGGEHRGRRVVRHAVGQPAPARLNKMYQVVDNLSHQAGAHALRAGVDFLVQRRHDHLSAVDPRRLHVLVARELPDRHLQQRRLHADVRRDASCRRRTRTSASTRRTSGRSARA